MKSALKEFDEFVDFCFNHGGTLRNHKAFGEMALGLREKIAAETTQAKSISFTFTCPNCGTFVGVDFAKSEDG